MKVGRVDQSSVVVHFLGKRESEEIEECLFVIAEYVAHLFLCLGQLLDFLVKPPFNPGVRTYGAAEDEHPRFKDAVDVVASSRHVLRCLPGQVVHRENFTLRSLKVESTPLFDVGAETVYGVEHKVRVTANKDIVLSGNCAASINTDVLVEFDEVWLDGDVEALASFGVTLDNTFTSWGSPYFSLMD